MKRVFYKVMTVLLVLTLSFSCLSVTCLANDDEKVTDDGFLYRITQEYGIVIYGYKGDAVDIVVPETIEGVDVIQLNDNTFRNNTNVKSITLPKHLKYVWHSALAGCLSLEAIYVDENNPHLCSIDGVLFSKDMKTLVKFPAAKAVTKYSVPDTVTILDTYAFSDCTKLTEINLPEGLITISNYAFSNCTGLVDFKIPESVVGIDDYCFENCVNLKSIELSGAIKFYGVNPFLGCLSLSSITLPNDGWIYSNDGVLYGSVVTEIRKYPPARPDTEYTIAEDTYFIDRYAFEDAVNLKKVNLPQSLQVIYQYAFNRCIGLQEINIPSQVYEIRKSAFLNCENLTTVYLPVSVNEIGEDAFAGCGNIKDVYYSGTAELFEGIEIAEGNEALLSANIHFAELSDNYDTASNYLLESEHNYSHDGENQWTMYREKATSIILTFSEDTCFAEGDIFYVYNELGELQGQYAGSYLGGKSVYVSGSGAKLKIVTDNKGDTAYGFSIDKAEVAEDRVVESLHDRKHKEDVARTIYHQGADKIKVFFDELTDANANEIRVFDKKDKVVYHCDSRVTDGGVLVEGDTLKIKMDANPAARSYGFKINKIITSYTRQSDDILESTATDPTETTTEKSDNSYGYKRIYLADTLGHGCPNIYYWSDEVISNWPGDKMIYLCKDGNSVDIYYADIPEVSDGFLFNYMDYGYSQEIFLIETTCNSFSLTYNGGTVSTRVYLAEPYVFGGADTDTPDIQVTDPTESTSATETPTEVTEPTNSTEPLSSVAATSESSEVLTTCTETSDSTEPTIDSPSKFYSVGDVNMDSEVNIKDVTTLQKFLAKLIEFNNFQMTLAYCNTDGRVDIKDATYLQKKIAGLI